jgi:23S rRNA pseudouridine2605 synthase
MTAKVPLNRALSKLGLLSRTQATEAIRAGRVHVDGRLVDDPSHPVVPERARIAIDGEIRGRTRWRTIVFHKPRGVVTTRRDPEGRRTIYDVLGRDGEGLIPVGRLDLASTGLLLLTTDTRLANWITDPANAVPRVYAVTVRGCVEPADASDLPASQVAIRKSSNRESHLVVELREGKNRQVRRMFEAIGHEVTRLKRVRFGGLELDALEPGEWRELTQADLRAAFPAWRGGGVRPRSDLGLTPGGTDAQ